MSYAFYEPKHSHTHHQTPCPLLAEDIQTLALACSVIAQALRDIRVSHQLVAWKNKYEKEAERRDALDAMQFLEEFTVNETLPWRQVTDTYLPGATPEQVIAWVKDEMKNNESFLQLIESRMRGGRC